MGFVFCARLDGFHEASQTGFDEFHSLRTPMTFNLDGSLPIGVRLETLSEGGELSYISLGRIFGWGQILLVYLSPANFATDQNGGCCDIIFEFVNYLPDMVEFYGAMVNSQERRKII